MKIITKEQPSLPSNLDEAAEDFAKKDWIHGGVWLDAVKQTFKAGAEWMAGQGEMIEGEVVATSTNGWESIRINKKLHSVGDKVIVQIRRK